MEGTSALTDKSLKRYLERYELLIKFHKQFPYNTGDDRAIVIVGVSYVETLLDHVLREFFPEDKECDKMFEFEGSLGTFSSRARMLYCLGLIEKVVYNDLKLVARIRNNFAHNIDASFDAKQIQEWCSALTWHKVAFTSNIPNETTSRDLFQVGVHQLISYLGGVVGIARGSRPTIRNNF